MGPDELRDFHAGIFKDCATELEGILPKLDPAAGSASPFGGIIGKAFELFNALKSGDITAIMVAVRDILNILLGDESTEKIEFQAQSAQGLFDRAKLIAVLIKLLPILLGA